MGMASIGSYRYDPDNFAGTVHDINWGVLDLGEIPSGSSFITFDTLAAWRTANPDLILESLSLTFRVLGTVSGATITVTNTLGGTLATVPWNGETSLEIPLDMEVGGILNRIQFNGSPINSGGDVHLDNVVANEYVEVVVPNCFWSMLVGTRQRCDIAPLQAGALTATIVETNASSTLVVDSTGALWAAGSNSSGKIGTGSSGDTFGALTAVITSPMITGVQEVVMARNTTYVLDADGLVWASGLETGSGQQYGFVSSLAGVRKLWKSAGNIAGSKQDVVFASMLDGSVKVAGANTHYLMGIGFVGAIDGWQAVDIVDADIAYIDNNNASCVITKTDGTVWYTGNNTFSQSGSSGGIKATRIDMGITDVVKTLTTGSYSMALKSDGTLWMMGANNYPVGGFTSPTSVTVWRNTPLTGVRDFWMDSSVVVAQKTDHTVHMAGRVGNDSAGLGLTYTNYIYTQILAPGVELIQALVGNTAMALRTSDSKLYTTGDFRPFGGANRTSFTPAEATDITYISGSPTSNDCLFAVNAASELYFLGEAYNGSSGMGAGTIQTTVLTRVPSIVTAQPVP